MSLLNLFRAGPASNGASNTRNEKRLYIVDAGSLLDRKGASKPSPRDQIDAMHRLSRFAARESIQLSAVFEGPELRKVANGEDFKGITIYFAEGEKDFSKSVMKLVRSASRHGSTVVTSNTSLETAVAGKGASTIRTSTLLRALDADGSGSGNGKSQGGGKGGQRSNRRRRPRRRSNEGASRSRHQQQSSSQGGNQDEKGVHEYIDTID